MRVRLFTSLLIMAIPLSLVAQDIYTDEEATPPPMNNAVPMAKGGEDESQKNTEVNTEEAQAQNNQAQKPPEDKLPAEPRDDVYSSESSQDSEPSYSQQAPAVSDRPRNNAPVNTQGSSLYDEMENSYAKDMDASDENFVEEEAAKSASEKKNKKSKKGKLASQKEKKNSEGEAITAEDFVMSHWLFGVNFEYDNQFSHSNTNGYGLGFQSLTYIRNGLYIGSAILWNHFSESVNYDSLKVTVSRTANHFLTGPMMRFAPKPFAIDAIVGWDRTTTQFNIKDQNTGNNLNAALGLADSGKYSDNALGMALRAAYTFELEEEWRLDFYANYSIGFYTGDNVAKDKKARMPQHFGLGALIWFKN